MTTRFKNAIDALVHAFFNDTLAKNDCAACAIGNMVAWSYGKKVEKGLFPVYLKEDEFGMPVYNSDWRAAFCTIEGIQKFDKDAFDMGFVNIALEKTGYYIYDLAKIEYAFEISTTIKAIEYRYHSKSDIMQDQYNGLMAVLDVLCEIEGIKDPAEYKQLFEIPAL